MSFLINLFLCEQHRIISIKSQGEPNTEGM